MDITIITLTVGLLTYYFFQKRKKKKMKKIELSVTDKKEITKIEKNCRQKITIPFS